LDQREACYFYEQQSEYTRNWCYGT
jgi:hypothetical protein